MPASMENLKPVQKNNDKTHFWMSSGVFRQSQISYFFVAQARPGMYRFYE